MILRQKESSMIQLNSQMILSLAVMLSSRAAVEEFLAFLSSFSAIIFALYSLFPSLSFLLPIMLYSSFISGLLTLIFTNLPVDWHCYCRLTLFSKRQSRYSLLAPYPLNLSLELFYTSTLLSSIKDGLIEECTDFMQSCPCL